MSSCLPFLPYLLFPFLLFPLIASFHLLSSFLVPPLSSSSFSNLLSSSPPFLLFPFPFIPFLSLPSLLRNLKFGMCGHHASSAATPGGVAAQVFSERRYMLSPVRLSSVCLSSVVCNVRAPYSGGSNFLQYFYGVRYLGHPLTFIENFMEIVPGEPLRLGVKHKRGSEVFYVILCVFYCVYFIVCTVLLLLRNKQ